MHLLLLIYAVFEVLHVLLPRVDLFRELLHGLAEGLLVIFGVLRHILVLLHLLDLLAQQLVERVVFRLHHLEADLQLVDAHCLLFVRRLVDLRLHQCLLRLLVLRNPL